MIFSLSEEQVMLRNMARQFATQTIEPVTTDDDRNEHFPRELVAEMAGLGFLGATVPQEYGGSGLDNISYAVIIEEVARTSLAIAMSVFGAHSPVAEALVTWGNQQQKQEYLPPLTKGGILGCHTLGESRRQTTAINSRARSDDKQWLVGGVNTSVINGGVSHLALVLARIDGNQDYDDIGAFLIDRDTAGFSSEDTLGKSGLRAANIASVNLQNCRVSDEGVLGRVADGSKLVQHLLDSIDFGVAACCVGASQACIDAGIKYAQERQAFGKPISNFGMIQDMIADMIIGTETARLLTYQVADLKNKQQPFRQQLSMARYLACSMALQAANHAIQIHGCYGYEKRTPVERYFRDVTMTTLYGGSLSTHKLAVAQSSLGICPT